MALNLFKPRGERSSNLRAANHLPQPPTQDEIRAREAQVARSMEAMLSLLLPSIHTNKHDEAMIELGASATTFVEPLSRHEVQTLACGLYLENAGVPMTYHDVLRLTDRFSGKPMNIAMVYKTIERLIERGMLIQHEDLAGDDRSRQYSIHGNGREAFRLAVLNSKLLAKTPSPAAA